MLPYNLLLFPIIGGFHVITNLDYFRYVNQRSSPQALVFNSVTVGIFLLLVAFIACSILTCILPDQVEFIKQNLFPVIVGSSNAYFGTAICSFFLGIFIPLVGNVFIDKRKAIFKAINKIGNDLELMFKTSFVENEPLQITLKNNKVFIGYVMSIPRPQPSEWSYITIFPVMAGHWDVEKRMFQTDIDYSKTYIHYVLNGEAKKIENLKVNLTLQVNEIISATYFDHKILEQVPPAKRRKRPRRRRRTPDFVPIATFRFVNN